MANMGIAVEEYDFETEDQKLAFIESERFETLFHCTVCEEGFTDADEALHCCHADCYEQAKEYVTERNADERMQEEKDGRPD